MAVAEEIETPLPFQLWKNAAPSRTPRAVWALWGACGVHIGHARWCRTGATSYLCSFPGARRNLLKRSLHAALASQCAGHLFVTHDHVGVLQTLLSPQKIVANGWSGVLFWFTAANIALIATQLFQSLRAAAQFRRWFMFFAGGVCLLELLEQASRTSNYYWLIPSKFHAVFGPFAYWNNFAQFVELALPITLWTGLSKRRSSPAPYLVVAAIQVCAVVASGFPRWCCPCAG